MTARAHRTAPPASDVSPTDLVHLPLADIDESATNPRTLFREDALEDLTASIRMRGVLQAILVRPAGTRYELVAGARRLRAAGRAGLTTIPACVRAMDDREARQAQVIENLQREEVHPLDEAEAYEGLIASDPASTVEAVAARVGKPVTYVYRRLMFTRLIPEVREVFRRDVITAAHAERLASVPDDRQPEALRRCFFHLLSGSDAESLDRNNLAPMKHLDDWLRSKVALDVHHEDTKRLLPELADGVAEEEQAGAQLLALSTQHFRTDTREPKPILARSWHLAEGRATCAHARAGVIVLGEDRGRLVRVCINKKGCAKHWGKRVTADRGEQAAQETAAADRMAKEQARAERERAFWDTQLRPALLKAIAQKARHAKITRPLVLVAAEAITGRQTELTTWCGTLASLDADRFAQVLIMALALNDAFSSDRLIARAKSLRSDVKALRKTLKPASVEVSAAAE
jgi:ParB/RepB/Spo0J family partition protein